MNPPILTIDEDGEWRINPGGEKNMLYWAGIEASNRYALVPVGGGTVTEDTMEWCVAHRCPSQTPFPSVCYRAQTWALIDEDTSDDPCRFARGTVVVTERKDKT